MSTCEQWHRSIRVATPSRTEADSGRSLAEFVSKVTPWSTSSCAGGGGGGGGAGGGGGGGGAGAGGGGAAGGGVGAAGVSPPNFMFIWNITVRGRTGT